MRPFSRLKKDSSDYASPVFINVYDLTPYNDYMYWMGLGIYHSGVEVHGMEFAFGAHDLATSGVFQVPPKNTPGFRYRQSVYIGDTTLDLKQLRVMLVRLAQEYPGNSYQLLLRNCNHFTDDACRRLVGRGIPGWVNRLARVAWCCNCFLPDGLRVEIVHNSPEFHSSPTDPDEGVRQVEAQQTALLQLPTTGKSSTPSL